MATKQTSNFTLTLELSAPELTNALLELAHAIRGTKSGEVTQTNVQNEVAAAQPEPIMAAPAPQPVPVAAPAPQPVPVAAPAPQPVPVQQAAVPVTAPAPQPVPVAPQPVPVAPQPVPVAPQPVPTAAPAPQPAPVAAPAPETKPALSLTAICNAGAALIDKGKMNDVTALLPKYGVHAVNQLKEDQLEAFAADLRALGADI